MHEVFVHLRASGRKRFGAARSSARRRREELDCRDRQGPGPAAVRKAICVLTTQRPEAALNSSTIIGTFKRRSDRCDRRAFWIVADTFTKIKRSAIMAAVRSRGNRGTELSLVALLGRHGFVGWRRHQSLPGKPDFIFRRQKVALFIDGCFWHGCSRHLRMPASNREYWLAKISRNKLRDKKVTKELRRRGWVVIRFWEHDLRNETQLVRRLRQALLRFA